MSIFGELLSAPFKIVEATAQVIGDVVEEI